VTQPANDSIESAHPANFAVEEKWIDGVVVLSVRREIDMLTAPLLTDAIVKVVTKQPPALIIDLTEVDFMETSAMSALVMAQREAAESTRLAIVADGPATSKPMKLMRLDELLRLYPSLDDALDDFR
jgi:anti-sigma B factor antagonist